MVFEYKALLNYIINNITKKSNKFMSKKSNFSERALQKINEMFGCEYKIRVNKAGNIDFVDRFSNVPGEHYILQKVKGDKYLWRRRVFTRAYPLNMRNRNNLTKHPDGYLHWNVYENATFDTENEAIEYFKNYSNKYRNKNIF